MSSKNIYLSFDLRRVFEGGDGFVWWCAEVLKMASVSKMSKTEEAKKTFFFGAKPRFF